MPERERERHIRHWILSARKRPARGETYDHGADTELGCEDAQDAQDARATLEWAEERVRVLVPGIELDAPVHATHRHRK